MPAIIKGRCISSETKIGVPFIPVTVDGLSTTTDYQGYFQIQAIPGRYVLKIRSPIHKPITRPLEMTEEKEYNLGNIEMVIAIFGWRDIQQ